MKYRAVFWNFEFQNILARFCTRLPTCSSKCANVELPRPLQVQGMSHSAHLGFLEESWGPYGKLAFYVGPAMNHYQCYKVYVSSTKRIITTDTIEYAEDNLFDIPYSSKEDELLDAGVDLQNIINDEKTHTFHPLSPRQTAMGKL